MKKKVLHFSIVCHHSGQRAQPLGPDRRHVRRPCGTGSRWLYFVRMDRPTATGAPLIMALCASRNAASGGPAGRLAYVGPEGHAFFSTRFLLAMRRVCGPLGTGPCISPGLDTVCMIMVSQQPGSIVTVLVSEAVWKRYDRIFGFGATPLRCHRSLFVWA